LFNKILHLVGAEDDATIQNTFIVIENAEYPIFNGEYHFTGFRSDGGRFVKGGIYNGQEVHFAISKLRFYL
jgi:hypothetical protein